MAIAAEGPGPLSIDDLEERGHAEPATRRDFLRASGILIAARPSSREKPPRPRPATTSAPRIAVVGAGIAGLNAAYRLKAAGYLARVYSADDRIGGRIVSIPDAVVPGVASEFGGEFIDSNHLEMLSLAGAFGLELIDLNKDSLATSYYFQGSQHTEAQVIRGLRPLARRLRADAARLSANPSYSRYNAADAFFDRMSMEEYLVSAGATGVAYQLIESAYLGEDGLALGDQSSLNLLTQIDPNLGNGLNLFGSSDERYKIRGGNGQVVSQLASRVAGQVELGQKLVSIRGGGLGYELTFVTSHGPTRTVPADFVILTVPFSMLRDVEMQVALPPIKRAAILEQAYAKNTKLLVGIRGRPWRALGYSGDVYTDEPFQQAWDSSALEPGPSSALAVFLGGEAAVAAGQGTALSQVQRYLPGIERVFPGVAATLDGKVARADWTGNPFVQASYSTYSVGQYTAIGGAQFFPVGNLHFAGEHCDHPENGYMNGAAKTGRIAAQNVLARILNPTRTMASPR